MGIYMKFTESLKSNRDFKNVYSKKKSYANKYLVMYALENGLDKNRLGISVSKKVGSGRVTGCMKSCITAALTLSSWRGSAQRMQVTKRLRVHCCMYRSFTGIW